MLADQRLGLLRVAFVERVENAAMLLVVLGDHVGCQDLLFHRVPLGIQAHVIDLAIDIDEQGVVRGMCPTARNEQVPPQSRRDFVVSRGTWRATWCRVGLDGKTCLHELERTHRHE